MTEISDKDSGGFRALVVNPGRKPPPKKKPGEPVALAFARFIQERRILIVEPNAVTRAALVESLCGLGARLPNLVVAASFERAVEELERARPAIVISELDLGRRKGLELMKVANPEDPDNDNRVFILLTGQRSDMTLATAIEADVDGCVLKPFNAHGLRDTIVSSVRSKRSKLEFRRRFEEGRKLLSLGRIDQAIERFNQARQTSQGLHFRALVDIFDVLVAHDRYRDAYAVARQISRFLPANPERLAKVLKLAVVTRQFEDVEWLYDLFSRIEVRSEDLIRHMCAALVFSARHFAERRDLPRAMEGFRKAAVIAAHRFWVLERIIVSLLETGHPRLADQFLKRFPPESRGLEVWLKLDFMVGAALDATGSWTLHQGRRLLLAGIHDPWIYQTMIRRALKGGLKRLATNLADEGAIRWPQHEGEFRSGCGTTAA